MDRRSFVVSLFGGLAAASLGGTAIAQAASRTPELAPTQPVGEIEASTKAALDQADAEFSQMHPNHRSYHHRPYHRRRPRHARPVVIPRHRRVVRNGRVYYVR